MQKARAMGGAPERNLPEESTGCWPYSERPRQSGLTELQGEIYPPKTSSQRLWGASSNSLLENGIFQAEF